MASVNSLDELLAAAAEHFDKNRPFLWMELHLLISALFPIYAGSHASLSRPSSAAKPDKKRTPSDNDNDDDEEEDTVQSMEGMSPKDAIIFPITAGVTLAALYFAIKTYGAAMINLVLGVYFSLIGTYSVAKLISDSWSFLQSFATPGYYREGGKLWKLVGSERKAVAVGDESASRSTPLPGLAGRIPLPASLTSVLWAMRDIATRKYAVKGFLKDVFDFEAILTQHNVLSTLLGIAAVSYSMFVDKPWWLTNLQGFAVSYGALQLMSPTTFATGTLILSGLFFYDIWAVFFTPLMVTVAKNLDVPIKLVFPRPDEPSSKPGEPPVKSFSMLGLGDIVLPGLMIALALRFDLYMFYLRKQKKRMEASTGEQTVEKVPYVPVTGHWGDRVWTFGSGSSNTASALPSQLRSSFPKPYFHATLIGYVFGMLLTIAAMTVFQHAQPALLYLVPTVLLSLWGTGLLRGELKHMWEFSEAITGEAIDEDAETKDSNAKKDDASSGSVCSPIWNSLFPDDKSKTVGSNTSSKTRDGKTEPIKDEKKPSTKDKQDSPGGSENGAKIFTLEISHHLPKSRSSAKEGSTESSGKRPEVSESVPDDTIVVSCADLDSDKDVVNHDEISP